MWAQITFEEFLLPISSEYIIYVKTRRFNYNQLQFQQLYYSIDIKIGISAQAKNIGCGCWETGFWQEYFDLRQKKTRYLEKYVMRIFISCTLLPNHGRWWDLNVRKVRITTRRWEDNTQEVCMGETRNAYRILVSYLKIEKGRMILRKQV